MYLCFYLHHIEKILNGRIYRFFHREGLYAYDPVRLLDYKLNCVSAIVDCCSGYDPDKGADFLTYAYYDIGNAILNCRRYEESGSFKNLDEYKTVRGIAWLYNKARDSRKKTIAAFMEKTGCTKRRRRIISQQPAKIVASFLSMIPFSVRATRNSARISIRISTRTQGKI